jgi:hypothetical protein
MSKRINVNPDHYKVAGRERPGGALVKTPARAQRELAARKRWERRTQKAKR